MTPGISGLRWEMHHLQDVAGLLLGPPAHNTGPPFVQPWDCLELLGHSSDTGMGCPFACLPTGMLAGLLLLLQEGQKSASVLPFTWQGWG